MAIKNYTTKVNPHDSAAQIYAVLGKKGARSITTEYADNGEPLAIGFMLILRGVPVWFKLPCNAQGVLDALKRDAEPRYHDMEHAKAVAWRILKDWVEAQMAIVEANQAELAEVFLPYAVHHSGQTMFERFSQGLALQAATAEVIEEEEKAAS